MKTTLIGMPEIKAVAETISTHAKEYEIGLKKKPTYIVLLDKGQGRTTVLEYIADIYKTTFPSGLDPYVEFEIEATMSAVEEIGVRLSDSAIYKPYYEEVCGVDICKFAHHLNELQTDLVIKFLKEASEHCFMLFFFPQEPNKSEQRLIDRLCDALDISSTIEATPYSAKDYAEIVIKHYKEVADFIGVDFSAFKRQLSANMKNVSSLSEAFKIGESFFDKNLSKLTTSLYIDEIKNEEVKR
mgnify:FL=1